MKGIPMNRFYKLLPGSLAALGFALTFPGVAWTQVPPAGTGASNLTYYVQYATEWQVARFPTVQEAITYRDKMTRGGGYEAKLADYHMAPDGSIRPGTGPNTEVYVRQWLTYNGSDRDAHYAFAKLVDLKSRGVETRVRLDYDVRAAPGESLFPQITKSVFLPHLPGQFQQTETAGSSVKGVWTLGAGGELRGQWEDGSGGWLRLQYWDATQVVFTRQDNGGTNDGLTARYAGRFVGNALMGEVTWTWRGRTWQGTWNASPGTSNIAKPQVSGTCSRGQAVPVAKGPAISVAGNTLTYTDPATRATNTIRWDDPPPNIKSGEDLTLISSSTHNRDARIEVHWQHGNRIAGGADSAVNTGGSEKSTFRQFRGGKLELVGGIKGHLRPTDSGYFQIAWNYTCQ
jgi:hypothetical protein